MTDKPHGSDASGPDTWNCKTAASPASAQMSGHTRNRISAPVDSKPCPPPPELPLKKRGTLYAASSRFELGAWVNIQGPPNGFDLLAIHFGQFLFEPEPPQGSGKQIPGRFKLHISNQGPGRNDQSPIIYPAFSLP